MLCIYLFPYICMCRYIFAYVRIYKKPYIFYRNTIGMKVLNLIFSAASFGVMW